MRATSGSIITTIIHRGPHELFQKARARKTDPFGYLGRVAEDGGCVTGILESSFPIYQARELQSMRRAEILALSYCLYLLRLLWIIDGLLFPHSQCGHECRDY